MSQWRNPKQYFLFLYDVRCMNLYEFEGKQLFAKHGIPVPRGVDIPRLGNARHAYQELGVRKVVVKPQVLSGRRGKAGAIRFCASADEAERAAAELFAADVRGQYVAGLRIEEKLNIAEEHYLSITYDTNARQPVLVYSAAGGMDIEDVPEAKIQ